jgi:ribosomal protein L37AE/L43A
MMATKAMTLQGSFGTYWPRSRRRRWTEFNKVMYISSRPKRCGLFDQRCHHANRHEDARHPWDSFDCADRRNIPDNTSKLEASSACSAWLSARPIGVNSCPETRITP